MSIFTVALLTKSDGPAVVKHLSKTFCYDEPVLSHLNIGAHPSFLRMCVDLIDHGLSYKAVNENGEIGGVFLAELHTRVITIRRVKIIVMCLEFHIKFNFFFFTN